MRHVAWETSERFQTRRVRDGLPTGNIIDESAHLKQGMASVGVSRQYAGVVGNVDTCQVGVYSSLCHDRYATLINERLFLPRCWAEAEARGERAGIPPNQRQPQSNPQQARAMIDENLAQGIQWDWMGGMGFTAIVSSSPKG
jgi:SRSO17 transposase